MPKCRKYMCFYLNILILAPTKKPWPYLLSTPPPYSALSKLQTTPLSLPTTQPLASPPQFPILVLLIYTREDSLILQLVPLYLFTCKYMLVLLHVPILAVRDRTIHRARDLMKLLLILTSKLDDSRKVTFFFHVACPLLFVSVVWTCTLCVLTISIARLPLFLASAPFFVC